jgi:hypothetical protein
MKNVLEVLRAKEQELVRVKQEIEALRVVLPLLGDAMDTLSPAPSIPIRTAQRVMQLP